MFINMGMGTCHVGVPERSGSEVWLAFQQRSNTFLVSDKTKERALSLQGQQIVGRQIYGKLIEDKGWSIKFVCRSLWCHPQADKGLKLCLVINCNPSWQRGEQGRLCEFVSWFRHVSGGQPFCICFSQFPSAQT